jgi:hypothetical protein
VGRRSFARVNGGGGSETAADRRLRFGDLAEDRGEMGHKAKGFGEGLASEAVGGGGSCYYCAKERRVFFSSTKYSLRFKI